MTGEFVGHLSSFHVPCRLTFIDPRFTITPNSVLLATDIAARGLDIPAVDHVIHYQIPRSADAYVHRNGRTARAMRKGFSLLMCAPDEKRVVRALLGNLGRRKRFHNLLFWSCLTHILHFRRG